MRKAAITRNEENLSIFTLGVNCGGSIRAMTDSVTVKLEGALTPTTAVPVEHPTPRSPDSSGFPPPPATTSADSASFRTSPLSPDVVLDSTGPDSARQSHSNTDLEASMTIEGDPGSITLAEHTLVEGMHDGEDSEEGKRRVKGVSAGSFSFVQAEGGEDDEKVGAVITAAEEEEEDIAEVKGIPLAFYDNEQIGKVTGTPLKSRSRKASHLRLDLPTKEGSAPWEQIDPPLNNLKAVTGYYSPTALQQKMNKGCVLLQLCPSLSINHLSFCADNRTPLFLQTTTYSQVLILLWATRT